VLPDLSRGFCESFTQFPSELPRTHHRPTLLRPQLSGRQLGSCGGGGWEFFTSRLGGESHFRGGGSSLFAHCLPQGVSKYLRRRWTDTGWGVTPRALFAPCFPIIFMPTTPTAQTPPGRAFRGRGGVVASKMYDGGEEEKSAGQEERGVEVLSGEEAIQRLLRTAEPPISGKSRSELWRCVHMF
jgi:hypothetical protein